MTELFDRVDEQLRNNWPVDAKDIEELLNLARIASNILCLLYTSPSPRDVEESRMPSSA